MNDCHLESATRKFLGIVAASGAEDNHSPRFEALRSGTPRENEGRAAQLPSIYADNQLPNYLES